MAKATAVPQVTPEMPEHPLLKSHMLISSKHVDYENLSAFEAVTMSAVLVLAVMAGLVLPLAR